MYGEVTQQEQNTKAKAAIAWKAMHAWRRDGDWNSVRTVPAPTVNQTIRACCTHIYNHQMTPAGVCGYYDATGGLDFMIRHHCAGDIRRPAAVTVHFDKDGNRTGASMISAAGYETVPTLEAARKLWARYARFVQYMKEGRHNWQFVRRVHYADNSIEAEYKSQLTGGESGA